jgi:hypothetical protein
VTGYGLDDRGSISSRGIDLSLYHHVQTGFGNHQASYPMNTEKFFRGGGESAYARSLLLIFSSFRICGALFSSPLYAFVAWCLDAKDILSIRWGNHDTEFLICSTSV